MKKNSKPVEDSKEFLVIERGFEPLTDCLEGNCSIQLSYSTIDFLCQMPSRCVFFHRHSLFKFALQQDNLAIKMPAEGRLKNL